MAIGRSETWIRRVALRPGVNRGTAAVGDDGLRLTGLFLERFIPYDEMESIVPRARTGFVEVALRDGRTIRFRVANPRELCLAVRERTRRLERREHSQPVASFRGARSSLRDWIARARGVLVGGYRSSSATPEELLRLVEDPRAEPEQRIGAALALSESAEPVRLRIADAAAATARPHLADAIAQVVAGEVDEGLLRRALER
jgi:hypothetical protein